MHNKYPQEDIGKLRLDLAVMKKNQLGVLGMNNINARMMNLIGRLKSRTNG